MARVLKILIGIVSFLIICVLVFMYLLSPVNKKETKEIIINTEGYTYSTLGSVLEEKGLVRSELIYKVYVKLFVKSNHLEAGEYKLNKSMDLEEIFEVLSKGNNYNPDVIRITFQEGWGVRKIAKVIEANTNNSYDDIMEVFTDRTYAEELINKYSFLDKSILNKNIYYPLEGYLFPDTYEFLNKDVSIKTIIETMLNEFGKKIEPYKEKIEKNKFSLNELIILASIAEVESLPGSDRKGVVGVFVNRINKNISLGSDMTAYYAYKLDDFKEGLSNAQFLNCSNPYNTRCLSKMGLPVGAISNPGIDSIVGAIEYEKHDYIYFVADCTGKTYFSKTDAEFQSTIKKLRNEGLWCEVSA